MKKYPQACIFQSRDFSIGLVFTKLVSYGAKESRNRNMRIILVKDRPSHISKSIYVFDRKHSILLNLPSLDICCFLLEFFTTTCFSHFSESKISMKSAVYLIRLYPSSMRSIDKNTRRDHVIVSECNISFAYNTTFH